MNANDISGLGHAMYCFNEWGEHVGIAGVALVGSSRGTHGRFRGSVLSSIFQPLIAADSMKVCAHEALLRTRDAAGAEISPDAAFLLPNDLAEVVYFDRLCRTVHALNFARQDTGEGDLFLNIDGRHLLGLETGHGHFFENILHRCGLQPNRIVIELLESRIVDQPRLHSAIENYKVLGYRIAIDDFGCQNSNFDRLWQLTPDIVKLDRSLIVQAETNPRARRILPMLVDIVHELGALVVCEGIETSAQNDLARDSGADLLQGFWYARPHEKLHANDKVLVAVSHGN